MGMILPSDPNAQAQTQRQMAMNQGLESIIGGLQGLQQQKQTQRQQALQEQQTAMNMREQGYDVTPQMIQQNLAPETSGIAKFFGAQDQVRPDLMANRTAEYKAKIASGLEDKKNAKKQQEFENRLALAKLSQDRSGKAQEYAFKKQELEQKKGDNTGISKLNAEEKNKIGSIASGFQALDTMTKALESGSGPSYIDINTPLIGAVMSDTPYTAAERNLAEVVGRLQSGGAISTDEEKRFRAMGPRAGDKPEIQREKILAQKNFMENKLAAYKMKPSDLAAQGFNLSDAFDVQQNKPILSDLKSTTSGVANANSAINHPQANKAMEWAKNNPNDPRAQQIMQRFK